MILARVVAVDVLRYERGIVDVDVDVVELRLFGVGLMLRLGLCARDDADSGVPICWGFHAIQYLHACGTQDQYYVATR